MQYFGEEKYSEAQMTLQRLIYSYPGQTFIDTAQFYLGMSFYEMENYPEAVGEFRRLLAAYPISEFADDAQYQLGMCAYEQSPEYYHDQDQTYTAIDEFSTFLTRYPRSVLEADARAKLNKLYDKLAKKMYKNGELYLRMNDYEPAIMYFAQVRDNYPNTEWARLAFYYTGEALMKQGRKSDALETFQNFVITFPDHKLAKKARKKAAKLQSSEPGG